MKKSSFHQDISPWPLIGDPKKEIYGQYGVRTSLMGVVRTMFSADMKTAIKEAKELNLPSEKDKDASKEFPDWKELALSFYRELYRKEPETYEHFLDPLDLIEFDNNEILTITASDYRN